MQKTATDIEKTSLKKNILKSIVIYIVISCCIVLQIQRCSSSMFTELAEAQHWLRGEQTCLPVKKWKIYKAQLAQPNNFFL